MSNAEKANFIDLIAQHILAPLQPTKKWNQRCWILVNWKKLRSSLANISFNDYLLG